MNSERLTRMQQAIADSGVDGWLFYGYHDVDMLGARILQLPPEPHFSRRWFCLIPASGPARKLVHRIEAAMLDSVPGDSRQYLGWRELQAGVEWVLESRKTVATQYSENSAKVGLTGGIACGKSHVLAELSRLGAETIDADKLAHEVMAPGEEAFDEIVGHFGEAVLAPDGTIDRKKLGAIVFNDDAQLQRLNAMVHPRVLDEEARRIEKLKLRPAPPGSLLSMRL